MSVFSKRFPAIIYIDEVQHDVHIDSSIWRRKITLVQNVCCRVLHCVCDGKWILLWIYYCRKTFGEHWHSHRDRLLAGNAYPSGHLVPSPILGLANAPIVETKFLELAMSLLDFSPRIPLGTFSILLGEHCDIQIAIDYEMKFKNYFTSSFWLNLFEFIVRYVYIIYL